MRLSYRLVSLSVGSGPWVNLRRHDINTVDRALHLVARRRVVRADLEPEPYLRADEVDGIVSAGLLNEPTGFEARIGNGCRSNRTTTISITIKLLSINYSGQKGDLLHL